MAKRKDNRYCVSATVAGKRKFFYGKTKREAEEKRDTYLSRLNDFPLMDEKITLAEWCSAWLDGMRSSITENTYRSYFGVLNTHLLVSPFGQTLMDQLTPALFRIKQQQMLDSGLSPRTVNYFHTVVSSALKQAVFDGIIPSNPLLAVRRVKQHRKEAKALNREQIIQFFNHLHDPMLARLCTFALQTGMRRSEILGLRWPDVDFKHKTVSVNQTVLALMGNSAVISPTTKTKSSRRTITISDALVHLLHTQRIYCNELGLKLGKPKACNLVFPSQALTPLAPDNVSRAVKKVFREAGLGEFTFHCFRRTHATFLIEQGINFKIVQYRLGHSSFATTMDTYSHVSPGMDAQAADVAGTLGKAK